MIRVSACKNLIAIVYDSSIFIEKSRNENPDDEDEWGVRKFFSIMEKRKGKDDFIYYWRSIF